MASKKLSTDTSLANSYKLSRGVASVARPSAPTIGTATDTAYGAMSVTFTASTLGPTASSYALTSSSGVTGTGASSPLTLTEVAEGTYTYTVSGVNANGTGPSSAASSSVVIASVDPSAYFPIATTTVPSAGAATVTFSSIPSTYTHLQLRVSTKQTTATAITTGNLYFNNDTTNTNYARHETFGDGVSTASNGIATGSNSSKVVFYAGSGTQFGPCVIDILDYANTNKNKVVRALGGVDNNGSGYAILTSGLWLSTAAITRIDLTFSAATSQQYSSFTLYGIKG